MQIAQSEEYQGNDWWEWAIWIEGSPDELRSIDSVTYTLHPSFRNPVKKITDRASKFRLESSGWGVFTIYAQVDLKGGKSRRLSHELQLNYPDTEKKAPALIRFVDVANASQHAATLMGAILDEAPNANVSPQQVPLGEKAADPGDFTTALTVMLTGPTVAAVAKGIQSWLARHDDVRLEISTSEGKSIKSITSANIVKILQSTMTALRK